MAAVGHIVSVLASALSKISPEDFLLLLLLSLVPSSALIAFLR
jgi:uncharacterized membrane protein YdjX (TVP38/TMEM64 family)